MMLSTINQRDVGPFKKVEMVKFQLLDIMLGTATPHSIKFNLNPMAPFTLVMVLKTIIFALSCDKF